MSFALPIALALSALALPIVGFYILRVRMRRIPVSTNLFWKQIFDEKPPRSLWQNFRHLLSLLLQLLMLGLLVLSIADPYFPWQLLQARRVVLVIDPSASMRAIDVAPSRLESARRDARDVIASLRFRDEMAIILAGKHPEVLVGMTNHVPTLNRALDSIKHLDAPTYVQSAIELGKQLIGKHPHGEVLVFTDGCFDLKPEVDRSKAKVEELDSTPRDGESQNEEVQVAYRIFGTEASNVGITQMQVRRSLSDPIGYEVLITLKNASKHHVKCRLELSLNDLPIDVLPLELKPMEQWSRAIEKTSLAGGHFVAELTQIRKSETETKDATTFASTSNHDHLAKSPDNINGLTTDDRAWAILPNRKLQKVLIVTAGNLFLQKVFQANPLVELEIRKEPPADWPQETLVVLHGSVPDKLPSGSLMIIDPNSSCDAWTIGQELENPIITEQDKASPLMTHIRLDNVLMPKTKQIQILVPSHALAKTISSDVIYAEIKRSNGKCLVLSVNLEQSDLAFRTAFPILIANALGWFTGQSGEMNESLQTGSSVAVKFESDAKKPGIGYRVFSPQSRTFPFHFTASTGAMDGMRSPILERDRSADKSVASGNPEGNSAWVIGHIGPLNEAGIWRIAEMDETKKSDSELEDVVREVAVNLADSRETDLFPNEKLVSKQPQSIIAGWLSRPAWFYLILAACGLTAIEWFLYQRRLIT